MKSVRSLFATQKNIAVAIPAYNEEKTLAGTLKSLPVSAEDVYVVDDGSTDKTSETASLFTRNVLSLKTNKGKAKATELLLHEFGLLDRYKFVVFSDADTQLDRKFILETIAAFDKKTAVVVGQVSNRSRGLVSAFRAFEYTLWQAIYKNAQSTMKVIFIAPGCASIYRTETLKRLSFDSDTLAEDADLTLQVHRRKAGWIKYASRAVVYTQDPPTVRAYFNQIVRWHSGIWQNIKKHRVPFGGQKVDFEFGYLTLEALFYPVFLLLALVLSGFYLKIFLLTLIAEVIMTAVLAFLVAVRKRRGDQLKYFLFFPLLRWVSSAVFFVTFVLVILLRRSGHKWKMAPRYSD